MKKTDKYKKFIEKLGKYKKFSLESIDKNDVMILEESAKLARLDILKMTTISGSGHLGGSFSTIDLYLLLWLCSDTGPQKIYDEERDIIIVSIGHTSAAVYSALSINGFFDPDDAIYNFRYEDSIFEGQLGSKVPGIEWSSGDLGNGLSLGCGYALALKKKGLENKVFVVMGDGEQQKGQIAEAARFAAKYKLNNLIAIVDKNKLQATDKTEIIMPNDISGNYLNCGWDVLNTDGHDFSMLYKTLRHSYLKAEKPTCIISETVMCKGLDGFEDKHESHGLCLSLDQYLKAAEKICQDRLLLNEYIDISKELTEDKRKESAIRISKYIKNNKNCIEDSMKASFSKEYEPGLKVSLRDAFGDALVEIGSNNISSDNTVPMAVLDCDLKVSVKTDKFEKHFPDCFFQAGIAEHNAAAAAGAISKTNLLTFFADFGVFGIDEVYNQLRQNDINETSVKLICTHNGLEVGEDGKSHHCLDYISLVSNLYNFKIIIPADANQTIHALNYISTNPGNFLLVLNRSKIPVLAGLNLKPAFGKDYVLKYGSSDWLKKGKEGTIIAYGHMAHRAIESSDILLNKYGLKAGVLNISSLPEIDEEKIYYAARITKNIIVYEDHNINTGLGNIVGSFLAENKLSCNFKKIAVSKYGLSAEEKYQYKYQGMLPEDLAAVFVNMINNGI